MAIAALLAITLDPALRMLFTRMDPFTFRPRWLARLATQVTVGTYYPEERHPISRALFRVYEPACRFVLRQPWTVIARRLALVVVTTVPVYLRLGHEFMPPLNEGTILYMPTTLPGISVTEASRAPADPGPHPARRSPRSSASSARPDAPRPRPTPRRSR